MKAIERIFLLGLFLLFLFFLGIQAYFFFYPEATEEARAQRLGAEAVDMSADIAAVDQAEEGMFLFLTFETEKSQASACTLLINDDIAGDFKGGVLSVKANAGDTISVVGGKQGEVLRLMDRPAELDDEFPNSLAVGGGKKFWGTVKLK